MHSKWKVWDFYSSSSGTSVFSHFGILCVGLYDPLLKNKILISIKKELESRQYRHVDAKDITSEWIDNNLKSLSLFGSDESFIITNMENIRKDVGEILFDEQLDISNRTIVCLYNKVDKNFKSLVNKKHINTLQIIAPAFWESEQLLDFIVGDFSISFSYEARMKIIESVEHTYIDFLNLISKLEVLYPASVIEVNQLDNVIEKKRVDNFEVARLMGLKKSKEFYRKILGANASYDDLRSLFYFLQTHLLKISSPDFLYKKNKLTKYDKQILDQSKIWKSNELDIMFKILRDFEFRAKLKDPLLFHDLNKSLLKNL
ncbi:MAG: hypothetical protein N4A33_05225 [Bacteriovoracaceae bacterium]|jgi:hypothetical protein|nr:hypothetical protein [Bacteriovoracaceae bacterium]